MIDLGLIIIQKKIGLGRWDAGTLGPLLCRQPSGQSESGEVLIFIFACRFQSSPFSDQWLQQALEIIFVVKIVHYTKISRAYFHGLGLIQTESNLSYDINIILFSRKWMIKLKTSREIDVLLNYTHHYDIITKIY